MRGDIDLSVSGGSKSGYVQTLRTIAKELDKRQRTLDMVRVATLLLGVIGSGLMLTGFLWTFVSYSQSLVFTVVGSGTSVATGVVGYLINVSRRRYNNRAVKRMLQELKSFVIKPDQIGNIMESVCEITTGQELKYSIQYPLLIILPIISLVNSIHDYNSTEFRDTSQGLQPFDTYFGLTSFGMSMEAFDVAVAGVGLFINSIGLIYYCVKTYRFKEARVSGHIRDVASTFYY